jgi:hypothetical protein
VDLDRFHAWILNVGTRELTPWAFDIDVWVLSESNVLLASLPII